jgi:hypothetical protein
MSGGEQPKRSQPYPSHGDNSEARFSDDEGDRQKPAP